VLPFVGVLLLEARHNRRVGEGGRVAQSAAFGDIAQETAHDFAASCFGKLGAEQNVVGTANGSNLGGNVGFELACQLRSRADAFSDRDKGGDGLAFDLVRAPDHGGFGDGGVVYPWC